MAIVGGIPFSVGVRASAFQCQQYYAVINCHGKVLPLLPCHQLSLIAFTITTLSSYLLDTIASTTVYSVVFRIQLPVSYCRQSLM